MQKLPAILLGTGLFIAIAAVVVGWFVFPAIVQSKITQQVRLVEGGDTYKKWENIPIPIYMKVHIFNVTNHKEVGLGGKPVLEELGPYVYQQKRMKTDIFINEQNDTIEYKQIINYFFRPDMSNGTEDDEICVVNLPFVGMAAKSLKMSNTQRYMVTEIMKDYPDEPPFITTTVSKLLFEGYFVPFIKDLSDLKGEDLLPNNTFGVYYGKNGSDSGLLEVFSGVKDNSKFGNMASWKGEPELEFWDDPYCNMINGSDGALFPPFVTRDRVLKIFSPELCRSLSLTYDSDTEILGLQGYRFTLPKEALEDPRTSEQNRCFCTDPGVNMTNCPKTGAYQLQSCRKGTPLIVSLPHFLDGDLEYLNHTVGLSPNREKHETVITLEPNTGVLLEAKKRIQINLQLKPNKYYKILKTLPSMILPVLWVDESAALTEVSANRIKDKLLKPQEIVGAGSWGLFGVGCLLILIALVIFIVRARRKDYKP